MRTKKRLTSLFMLLLVTFIFSIPALAATTACKIGTKEYTSLSKAVASVKDGQTIKVVRDIKTTKEVNIDNKKTFTIDFGGYRYTNTADCWAFGIRPGSKVTMKNMYITAKGAFMVGGRLTLVSGKMTDGYIQVRDDGDTKGTLNIKGGTYNIKKVNDEGPWIDNYGTVNVTKGNFKKAADMQNNGKMTIEGGTFTYSGGHNAIANTGTLTISGGEFTCTNGFELISNIGKATITDGTFSSGKVQTLSNHQSKDRKVQFFIKGGSFKTSEKQVLVSDKKTYVTISGGTFRKTVDNGPAMILSGIIRISGGTFKGDITVSGKATLTGGKTTTRVIADPKAVVTIEKFTVNQGSTVPPGPGFGNPTLLAREGKIIVNGGSFTSPNGYGYAEVNGGKVEFGITDYKKLFNVKKLKYKG